MYTTCIGFGNPPVTFRAQTDTSWGPLFTPSVDCTYDSHEGEYCRIHPMYNSTDSPTYHADPRPCKVCYHGQAGICTWGNVLQGNLYIAGMEIQGQIFEEAKMWRPSLVDHDDLYDTVLGLALGTTKEEWSTLNALSPIQNMIEQELLDMNMLTLRPARADEEEGELILGRLPDSVDSKALIHLPLTNETGGHWFWEYNASIEWQASLQNINMGHNASTSPISITTSNTTAIILLSFPWIQLPSEIANSINAQIGIHEEFRWVDCETRSSIPDLTIVIDPPG
ncbi:acid protease [Zopfia rhizophila CBS 207.26]|uniref:Acid protease n=1 Tax=Zopfia rhizophila CBS 207.26 TaxID=1314779 RepID=A0A6A6EAL8_9PEZI|nr:acid protease [Zopfia rhizophila CBS 207.26]